MKTSVMSGFFFSCFVCSLLLIGLPHSALAEDPCVTDPLALGTPDDGPCEGITTWVYLGTSDSTQTFRWNKKDQSPDDWRFTFQDFEMPPNVYCQTTRHAVPATGKEDLVCPTPPWTAFKGMVEYWDSDGAKLTRNSYFLTY